MSNRFSAADGSLAHGATVVADARSQLVSELSALQNNLSQIGGAWRGVGAVAFQRLIARWHADATRITGALEGFERELAAAQTAYEAQDLAQSDSFARLAGRLDAAGVA